jgi:hypothetical protein
LKRLLYAFRRCCLFPLRFRVSFQPPKLTSRHSSKSRAVFSPLSTATSKVKFFSYFRPLFAASDPSVPFERFSALPALSNHLKSAGAVADDLYLSLRLSPPVSLPVSRLWGSMQEGHSNFQLHAQIKEFITRFRDDLCIFFLFFLFLSSSEPRMI